MQLWPGSKSFYEHQSLGDSWVMLTDGSEKEPITGAFFVRAWIQSLHTTEDVLTLLQATWVGGLVSHGQGVCVFDSVTFHQPVTLSPCQSSRHEHQKELENVWMFLCARCECEVPLVMPGFFVLSCRLFVFVCCCSPVCTFKHAQIHTQTSLLSNLSCPGLLSAIHFPVSQPSIIPACPQMQPSLLKTMRGNDVYRSRRRLRQAKRERGGGGFLIKIAIDWDS